MNRARRLLIAGNWKMFRGGPEGMALAAECAQLTRTVPSVDLLIAPPFTLLAAVAEDCEQAKLLLAAQNMHARSEGAFTGEISAAMLKECGATHVILGHSERRQLFGETDQGVASKTVAALAAGLRPIICVGETLEQRDAGDTLATVSGQLAACLDAHLDAWQAAIANAQAVVLAYEPVWAIGTGKTAGPAEAEAVHLALRKELGRRDPRLAEATRILYGGSVKADNSKALFDCPNVDGALIGGASLDIASFSAIARNAEALARALS
jgi:triosephosphate isomerase (TIM)